ncbi:MAG: methylated-DNA--[protein]-cysteine S-methyltransferase [Anaerolineae bacterium]|nr:methylated-DNA--[protein]-cysteine S-methyltransferase [Anaerolineae bacterium]
MAASNIMFTDTPLGVVWLWATDEGLCSLGFGDTVKRKEHHRLVNNGIDTPRPVTTDLLEEARAQLQAYFNRRLQEFNLPLDLRGTDFQHLVWLQLRHRPYGQTTTYGEIATVLGKPKASRAVGQAVGANPVSIVVPCHRVVGVGGKLTGYGGGIERKAALLELEQAGLQLRIPLKWSAVRGS